MQTGAKVKFGRSFNGYLFITFQNYEYRRHRQNANGTVQWRCRRCKCRALLTTWADQVLGTIPVHTHDGKWSFLFTFKSLILELANKSTLVVSKCIG